MKKIVFLVLSFLFFLSGFATEKYNVIIYGKSSPEVVLIKLYLIDYNYNKPERIIAVDSIDEEGNYTLRAYIDKPQIAFILWDKVLIHPNDSVEINFSFDKPYYQHSQMNISPNKNIFFYSFFYTTLGDWTYGGSKGGVFKSDYYLLIREKQFDFEKYYSENSMRLKEITDSLKVFNKLFFLTKTEYNLIYYEIYSEYIYYLLLPLKKFNLRNFSVPDYYMAKINGYISDVSLGNTSFYALIAQEYLYSILTDPKENDETTNKLNKLFNAIDTFFKSRPEIRIGLYLHVLNSYFNCNDELNTFILNKYNALLSKTRQSKYKDEIKKLYAIFQIKNIKNLSDEVLDEKLFDNTGKILTLKDALKINNDSTFLYIDFWATWCHPCIEEGKYFEENIKKFDSIGLKKIEISLDESFSKWQRYINNSSQKKIKQTFCAINPRHLRDLLNIESIPRYLILDKKNRIISLDGPRPLEIKAIRDIISSK